MRARSLAIRARASAAAVALALCAFPLPARAAEPDPIEQARTRFQQGVAFFESGRYVDALEQFELAQAAAPNPAVLYNIGRVRALVGRFVEAAAALDVYLAEAGPTLPAERRDQVVLLLADARAHVGGVIVRVDRDGSEVRVDGRAVGRSPLDRAVPLAAGSHAIDAVGDDGRVASTTVFVRGGATEPVELRLPRAEASPPRPPEPRVADPARPALRTAGWTLATSGVLLAAAGGVALGLGYRSHQRGVEDARAALADGSLAAYDDARDAMGRADRWQTAGTTALAVGCAALVGGVVLLRAAPAAPSVTLGAVPGGAGAALAGSW